jgi:hypothetical protein
MDKLTAALEALIPARFQDRAKALIAALAALLTPAAALAVAGETDWRVYLGAVLGGAVVGGGLTYAAPANKA